MARKKVAKPTKAKKTISTKKTVKKQPKAASLSSVDSMEKNFRETPRQLSALSLKDIASLKQQKNKLSVELKKAFLLTKAIEKRCEFLAKAKSTATTKKQLASAKKANATVTAAAKEMNTKVVHLDKQILSLHQKQAKFAALAKMISQFDKQWKQSAINTKKIAPKKSAKVKKEHLPSFHNATTDRATENLNEPKMNKTEESIS